MSTAYTTSPRARIRKVVQERIYILVNATPRDVAIPWGGETIYIPARTRAIPPHPKFADARHSYINPETGKMVPGTLVVGDLIVSGEFGEREIKWDAAEMILNKIGESHEMEFGKRGITWLDGQPSRETFKVAFLEAKERFEQSVVKDAQFIVWERTQQEARYNDLKQPIPPMPEYVQEAAAIVKKAAEIQGRRVSELLDDVAAEAKMLASFEGPEEVDLPLGSVAAAGPGVEEGFIEEEGQVAPPRQQPVAPAVPAPVAQPSQASSHVVDGAPPAEEPAAVQPAENADVSRRASKEEQEKIMADARRDAQRRREEAGSKVKMKL